MVHYVESTYSHGSEQPRKDIFEIFFRKSQVMNFVHTDHNFEKVYNLWNDFHYGGEVNVRENINTAGENTPQNGKKECEEGKNVFKFCSDEQGNRSIMKRNLIGIYIPINRSIHSVDINYHYIFKCLKDSFKGKLLWEIYFILPNCIFYLSFVESFKALIYYERVIEHTSRENKKRDLTLQMKMKNNLLQKLYGKRKADLRKALREELEKILSQKKYTKVIYEDAIELCSFFSNFLKINSFNFIDLHHLYQDVIELYEINLSKRSIFSVIPILFPRIFDSSLVCEYGKVLSSEGMHYKKGVNGSNQILRKDGISTPWKEKYGSALKYEKSSPESRKDNMPNTDNGADEFYKIKRKILSICNSADDSNQLLNFEKHLIHILYIFPCAHNLLIKYKDLEGHNICYKINGFVDKYNALHNFGASLVKIKNAKLSSNGGIRRRNKIVPSQITSSSYHLNSGRLVNSVCNNLSENEEAIYSHSLIVGKNIYAYIYEVNRCSKSIFFRFNLNAKNIIFRNILSNEVKWSSLKRKRNGRKLSRVWRNINESLFLSKSKVQISRNQKLYNYKNNILTGVLYDKENNFHYFDDKRVGDVVLCTICDISVCGKFIYLQRFDKENLIFHFRKEKYVNLEKNFDYDDANNLDEKMLRELL
ncbi:conserved Plasmodium protein, unknown function [Plasmodium knowlesi strain H]|uniref:Uncharacterized protein n=3 Tax=Plasmodium knowlesi TaxID=5850 RepID=A0A5K1UQN8_PLAKH|nr:conserved Plasmodium protein, unknown function [Plasmodium knowlesi strain H]OTN68625.1 Uncharacterized protein PKNOH_S01009900 [Plasmodium knowlesi]CAA9986100.1 conserved Plasmodium protein, unknown function [Plasmodium knowlesi strain H]SBO25257.1 conserved Plasmodium protein, unknown function [Plasmodium knowlesi strain H]SBO27596.1 conserved Plasmodium protein, unknown function [Plasmodium knowlesi strain H]VVS75574.1 conserved Plasmodium protein, unknown function [Plasmodium knowlesi s|eukprot:XP_002257511.1 hypothetical protein, conserved in Plasmodium species [Plasmodium knowlesi strain H]